MLLVLHHEKDPKQVCVYTCVCVTVTKLMQKAAMLVSAALKLEVY